MTLLRADERGGEELAEAAVRKWRVGEWELVFPVAVPRRRSGEFIFLVAEQEGMKWKSGSCSDSETRKWRWQKDDDGACLGPEL
jgi:hypothetical protein